MRNIGKFEVIYGSIAIAIGITVYDLEKGMIVLPVTIGLIVLFVVAEAIFESGADQGRKDAIKRRAPTSKRNNSQNDPDE